MDHLLTAAPLGVKYSGRIASCFGILSGYTDSALLEWLQGQCGREEWLQGQCGGEVGSSRGSGTPGTTTINWVGGNLSSWQYGGCITY
jgi:hypothetical protein